MMSHVLEMRRRLIQLTAYFFILFVLFYYYSDFVFQWMMSPLLRLMPESEGLIITHVLMPVYIPLKLAAELAILCVTPCVLYHLWRFAAPGLYPGERHKLGWVIAGSLMLFCFGAVFCFYGVLPLMLTCFIKTVPSYVKFMPELDSSLAFMLHMSVLFGLCFQVPLICMVLVKSRLVSLNVLKKARPYWIVTAFILGMLLTPPDVMSQIILAVPLCLLYELGLVLSKISSSEHALIQNKEN
jgi:sec-independent protein translocase protein TatC